MYSFESVLDGIKFSVFLFSTFTGYTHPFSPSHPIDLNEAFNRQRQTFYLAWYLEGDAPRSQKDIKPFGKGPKLHYLEKYWLLFEDLPIIYGHKKETGRYFHFVEKSGDKFLIGDEIEPSNALRSDLIYTYTINKDRQVIESYLVKKGLMDKYTYTYKAGGAMEKVDIYRSAPPKEG